MSDRPVTEYIPEDAPPPGGGMRWIPDGTFQMGDDNAYPEEAPAHTVAVSGFWIDEYVVTNADFAAFVTATGYLTVAERPLDPAAYPGADPSLLTPGSSVFFMPTRPANLGDIRSRWAYVPGAYWRHPEGPGSTVEGRESTQSYMWRLRTPRPTPLGPARRCLPRPNGNLLPVAD